MSENNASVLEMQVQLTIIENLGIRIYSTLPPVIAELIANAYDADATAVKITLPSDQVSPGSEITVEDDGSGMKFSEINATYLSIGRNRRKGIGKLSAFGVASEIEITTTAEKETTRFSLNLNDMNETPPNEKYKPAYQFIPDDSRPNGTCIKLKGLVRKRPIDIPTLRAQIARRFSCITSSFSVVINGNPITPAERNLSALCEAVTTYDGPIDPAGRLHAKGWIGALKKQIDPQIGAGVVLMVRGKLAQEPTFFDTPRMGWINVADQYIVGELEADFLDLDDSEDLILTSRAGISWDSEEGQFIKAWGQKEIRKIASQWGERRREEKEAVIKENPEFKEWLTKLPKSEKKVATRVIKAIAADGQLSDERVLELASFMKQSFEFQAFRELAQEISADPTREDTRIVELFEEWSLTEVREVMRVAEGRLRAIEQLEKLIDTNAREVPTLHKFLAQYPWILDPSWTLAYDEVYYSTILRDNFKEKQATPDENRRIDFVCLGAGDTIHVVELKRPKVKIDVEALNQLESYVAFVQQRLGNAPEGRSYQSAAGYIIGEDIEDDYRVQHKKKTLEMSRMYIRKYANLLSMAKRLHKEFSEKMRLS